MDDKKTDKQTVFVRGVSFDADDQDFNDFFSDIGPVRQAFLVKSKGGAKHKGFGFVHFALQEDAERAAAELNGKELKGRRIQVEVALKRAPLEERKKKRKQQVPEEDGNQEDSPPATEQPPPQPQQEEQPPPAKKAKPARPAHGGGGQQGAAEAKHKMVRAVAVGRLTPDTLASAVSLAKAAGEVEEIINPLPQSVFDHYKLERDGCSGNAFLAVYSSVKHAMAAVAKLHGQPATQDSVAGAEGGPGGGKKKKKKGGKQQSGAAGEEGSTAGPGGVVMWARQVSGEGLHLKRWRLIVRNLPFQVSEAELHAAFDPAGFVWELTLPRSADGKARGFAFVGFTCRAHAEQGIRLVNGQQVAGRPVAVDWALSKAQFAAAGKPAGGAIGEGEAKEANGLDGLDSDDEQPLAAKAAGGKLPGHESDSDDEAAADVAPEQEHAMLHSVIDDILGSGTASLGNGPAAAAMAAAAGGKAKSAAGEAGHQDGGKAREEEEQVEEGEAPGGGDMFSKEALQKRSAAQRAALERLDRQLQSKPLGKAVAAAAAAEAANKEAGAGVEEQAGAGGAAAKQAQRERPEGVTVFVRGLPLDVSKQQLHTKMQAFGKVLSCRLVVDKASGRLKGTAFVDFADAQAAHKVAEACAKARRKEGPGVIVAGRTVDVDLALGHDDIRSLAAQKASERGPRDKRNLYLAKEGAIAEGSPAWEEMSQQDRNKRKRAAVEKKTKLASPNFLVSATRLSVRNIPPTWTEKQLKQLFVDAVKERASKADPRVKQVKILVEEEGAGAGGPRSKGIGFVEFEDQEHALCALRQLNNNPKPWSKERRPIVEFAIENAKILKAREAKLARMKQQQQPQQQAEQQQTEQPPSEAGGADSGQGGPPVKRLRTERGSQRQPGGEAAEQAQQQELGEGGGGGDEAAQDGPAQQVPAQQQSKRQRRKEIKLKLRAVKQQKLQEAAAAAAAGEQQGANGVAAQPGEGGAHNKAKKRREQRKAKKQGTAASVAGRATATPASPAAAPASGSKQPARQAAGHASGGKPQQQQQRPPRGVGKGEGQLKQQQGQQPARPATTGGVNSRAAKGKQQVQREQQAQQRKRRSDETLDSLVASVPGGQRQPNKPRQKGDKPDRLDKLAAEYRAKFFDGGSKGKAGGKAAAKGGAQQPANGLRLGLKRWFE